MKKIAKLIAITLCLATTTFAMEEESIDLNTRTLRAVSQARQTLSQIPIDNLEKLSKEFRNLANINPEKMEGLFAAQTYTDLLIQYYQYLTKELDILDK